MDSTAIPDDSVNDVGDILSRATSQRTSEATTRPPNAVETAAAAECECCDDDCIDCD